MYLFYIVNVLYIFYLKIHQNTLAAALCRDRKRRKAAWTSLD